MRCHAENAAAEKAAKKQRIMEIIAEQDDKALLQKPREELLKELESL